MIELRPHHVDLVEHVLCRRKQYEAKPKQNKTTLEVVNALLEYLHSHLDEKMLIVKGLDSVCLGKIPNRPCPMKTARCKRFLIVDYNAAKRYDINFGESYANREILLKIRQNIEKEYKIEDVLSKYPELSIQS